MPYIYDDQLIDAVSVRRRRLAHALMFAAGRQRRQWSDQLKFFVGSAFLAVLVCAGCVAVSFVGNLLEKEREKRERQEQQTSSVVRVDHLYDATRSLRDLTGPAR